MGDSTELNTAPAELDTPLPNEEEERRWTSGAALISMGGIAILLAMGYFFMPHPGRSIPTPPPSATATPVSVLKEPGPVRVATVRPSHPVPAGHASRFSSKGLRTAPGLGTTFLDVVRKNNAKAYVGRLLRFDSINVVTTPSANVLSVGSSPVDSVMVKLDPAIARARAVPQIAPGDKVFLVGRLMPAPSEETLRRWGVTPQEEDQIGHHALYIRAMVVQDAPY